MPDLTEKPASDFEREMYWAVVEEASLAELPLGVTDVVNSGSVVHGPWPASACSARLLQWFDAGWIDLYDEREGHPSNTPDIPGPPATRHGPTALIDRDHARQLLGAWTEWLDDDEKWHCVRVVSTVRGQRDLIEPE